MTFIVTFLVRSRDSRGAHHRRPGTAASWLACRHAVAASSRRRAHDVVGRRGEGKDPRDTKGRRDGAACAGRRPFSSTRRLVRQLPLALTHGIAVMASRASTIALLTRRRRHACAHVRRDPHAPPLGDRRAVSRPCARERHAMAPGIRWAITSAASRSPCPVGGGASYRPAAPSRCSIRNAPDTRAGLPARAPSIQKRLDGGR